MLDKLTFTTIVGTTLVVETIMLFLFRFTKTPFSGPYINRWYTNLRWSAIILDITIFIIGFYLAKYVYSYLLRKKIISDKNSIRNYLLILLTIQIIHDILFYKLIIQKSKKGMSPVMDEFKHYSKGAGINAIAGDSFMYLLSIPVLLQVSKLQTQEIQVLSTFCLYLLGYFVYQKPLA